MAGVEETVRKALSIGSFTAPDEFAGRLLAPAHLPQEQAQRAGHIPTAANVPWSKAANDDGTFKSDEELTALYDEVGFDTDKDTIALCRIGERSSLTWFVLQEILGKKNVKNYDGSWTEYGSLVGVPIALGDEPELERLHGVGDRRCRFVCTLVALRHADDPEPLVATGRWEATLLDAPRGGNGFGYDPSFVPVGDTRTAAVLSEDDQYRRSQRAQALQKINDGDALIVDGDSGRIVVEPGPDDLRDFLPGVLTELMRDIALPNGIGEVGYTEADVDDLVEGTMKQQRLLATAPREVTEADAATILRASLELW